MVGSGGACRCEREVPRSGAHGLSGSMAEVLAVGLFGKVYGCEWRWGDMMTGGMDLDLDCSCGLDAMRCG